MRGARHLMATATIDSSAWTGLAASPCEAELRVRPYRLVRPRGAFLAAEMMLLAVAVMQGAWSGHVLGTLVLCAVCALFFHIKSLDRSIVSSKSSQFCIDLLDCVALGFLTSALLFHVFPGLVLRVETALGTALLIGLLPVSVRLCLGHLVTRGKFVDEILIVGTGDLPTKLYRALGRSMAHSPLPTQMPNLSESRTRRGMVDLAELNELVINGRISRVVIAE